MDLQSRKRRKQRMVDRVASRVCAVVMCSALILPGGSLLFASSPAAPVTAPAFAVPIPAEQLDSLVAPIALYPDNLLAQVLVASTYPLELIQLHQWLQNNPEIAKDQKK